jgi:hypothetical protein
LSALGPIHPSFLKKRWMDGWMDGWMMLGHTFDPCCAHFGLVIWTPSAHYKLILVYPWHFPSIFFEKRDAWMDGWMMPRHMFHSPMLCTFWACNGCLVPITNPSLRTLGPFHPFFGWMDDA